MCVNVSTTHSFLSPFHGCLTIRESLKAKLGKDLTLLPFCVKTGSSRSYTGGFQRVGVACSCFLQLQKLQCLTDRSPFSYSDLVTLLFKLSVPEYPRHLAQRRQALWRAVLPVLDTASGLGPIVTTTTSAGQLNLFYSILRTTLMPL